MILSSQTDEIFPDRTPNAFPRIFKEAVDAGVTNFEIRNVEGQRVPHVQAGAWDRLKRYGKEYGITFSTVSPGLFKTNLQSDLLPLHRKYIVDMSLDLADTIGVKTLVTFAPLRDARDQPDAFKRIVEMLRAVAERAASRGAVLHLENFPGSWADSSDSCLALMKAVDHPAFGYIWDVANLYEVEKVHFLEGYKKLKPYIRNVHLKDARFEDGKIVWTIFGEGDTDIKGQIETLKADGYKGTLTLEAHTDPYLDNNKDFARSVAYLRTVL